MLIRRIHFSGLPATETYPFNLPIIQGLNILDLNNPVTIFIGENGSGKSTILEGIAAAMNLPALGDKPIKTDPTLAAAREFGKYLQFTPKTLPKDGFFMRAEDYFSYLKQIENERIEYLAEIRRVEEEYKDRSKFAQNQAKMTYVGVLRSIQRKFGDNADGQSHGESFLQIFSDRISMGGFYIIDEPEAALSPISQLAFVHLVKRAVDLSAQFLIATHSPIIMAYPNAQLLQCENDAITPISYDDSNHVRWYRDFLQNPAAFIHRL
jgi:predicted ATPase